MSNSPENNQTFLDLFGSVSADLPLAGNASLEKLRKQNLEKFDELGFPTKRREEWKYTDLTSFGRKAFTKSSPSDGAVRNASPFHDVDTIALVFVNGFFRADLSSLSDVPEGVIVQSLSSLEEFPEWAEEILSEQNQPADHAVFSLNTALMRDGYLAYVSADTVLEKPIHIRFVTDLMDASSHPAAFVRNMVLLEHGAKATILETYESSAEDDYFTSSASQFVMRDRATLTHVKLQNEGAKATHLATQLVTTGVEASFSGFYFNGGAELCRNEIHGNFDGDGGHIQLDGVFLGAGNQHCDNTTVINHSVPSCSSSQIFKGVLDDSARGVYQGQVVVAKDAQHTDGRQLLKTLLLSDKAEIDAKPELKIFADDVQCAHGATAGDIDEDSLFYLQSRGIDEPTARSLLVEAFLTEVLERIEREDVRSVCNEQISAWLNRHGKGRQDAG